MSTSLYPSTQLLVANAFCYRTMSVGMGPAPEDDISITVILVIAVGLGIPLVLMIFSVVFVCVKTIRRKRLNSSEYTAINE